MRTICVRERRTGAPTLWRCWADWRAGRTGPWHVRLAEPAAAPCAMCWGQRRIWEPGPLGLLPVAPPAPAPAACGGRPPEPTVAGPMETRTCCASAAPARRDETGARSRGALSEVD